MRRLHRPPRMSRDHATAWATRFVWVIMVVTLVGFLWWFTNDVNRRIDAAQDASARDRATTAQSLEGLRRANQQLRAAGEKPVVTPEDIVKDPTLSAPASGPALTQAQVDLAVATYCGSGSCTASVTPRQVAVAVASYCNMDGQCRGPRGSVGQDGANGAAGDSGQDGAEGAVGPTGPPGPPPTDQQVLLGVQTYCSNNSCRGPVGPAGPTGDVGPAGVGITALACDSLVPLTIRVTYSDGTTQSVSCGGSS